MSAAFALLMMVVVVSSTQLPLVSLPANLVAVPLYSQETDYSCGPSSVLSMLRYWDWKVYRNVTEQELYGPLHTTTEYGTAPGPIARYFSVHHMPSTLLFNASISQLEKSIDEGRPAIVLFQAWNGAKNMNYTDDWSDGHYNVVVGYDTQNLFFMDPWTKEPSFVYIPKEDFQTRWHDIIAGKVKVYQAAIFVRGLSTPHPVPPVRSTALYEE